MIVFLLLTALTILPVFTFTQHEMYESWPAWAVNASDTSNPAFAGDVDALNRTFSPVKVAVRVAHQNAIIAFPVPTDLAWYARSTEALLLLDAYYESNLIQTTVLRAQLRKVWGNDSVVCADCVVKEAWGKRGGDGMEFLRRGEVYAEFSKDEMEEGGDVYAAVEGDGEKGVGLRVHLPSILPRIQLNFSKANPEVVLSVSGWIYIPIHPEEELYWSRHMLSAWEVGNLSSSLASRANTSFPSEILASLPGNQVKKVVLGSTFGCALLGTQRVRCWGSSDVGVLSGEIGDDELFFDGEDAGVEGVVDIAAGDSHVCAVIEENGAHNLLCWGTNSVGQLGYGNSETIGDNEEIDSGGWVDFGGEVEQVVAAQSSTCVVRKEDGVVKCWGPNTQGLLGIPGRRDPIGAGQTPAEVSEGVQLGGDVGNITMMGHSGAHACVLFESGNMRCWGSGTGGKLGHGDENSVGYSSEVYTAGDVPFPAPVYSISLSSTATCVIMNDTRAVHCVGEGGSGLMGNGATSNVLSAASSTAIPLQSEVESISVSSTHACAVLTPSHRLVCWGDGSGGGTGFGDGEVVGDDEEAGVGKYAAVEVGREVASVVVGEDVTCVIDLDERLLCWGDGEGGMTGRGSEEVIGDDEKVLDAPLCTTPVQCVHQDGTNLLSTLPSPIGEWNQGVVKVASGAGKIACALLGGGRVRCWGDGESGLGYGNTNDIGDDEDIFSLGDVPLSGKAVDIDVSDSHACAILESGQVQCWGEGEHGKLGYGDELNIGDDEVPSDIGVLDLDVQDPREGRDGVYVLKVSAGNRNTCILLSTWGVRCWGDGTWSGLGVGNSGDVHDAADAVDVKLGARAKDVAVGVSHSCAVTMEGRVRCWGLGGSGQLGYGNDDNVGSTNTPADVGDVPLSSSIHAVQASTGNAYSCALDTDGRVSCWGEGSSGRTGHGDTVDYGKSSSNPVSSAPFVSLGENAIVQVAAASFHTCALSVELEVYCFGSSSVGALGLESVTAIGSSLAADFYGAVDVGESVVVISAASSNTFAVTLSGFVQSWGEGIAALGQQSTTDAGSSLPPSHYSPIPIETLAYLSSTGAASDADALSFASPTSNTGSTLTTINRPSLTIPLPPSLPFSTTSLTAILGAGQSDTTSCLTETGVVEIGGSFMCIGDSYEEGTAGRNGVRSVWISASTPSPSLLSTAGGTEVTLYGDFTALSTYFGLPTISFGDGSPFQYTATDVFLHESSTRLSFTAPAGVSHSHSISFSFSAAFPNSLTTPLLSSLHSSQYLPTVSYSPPTISFLSSSTLAVSGGSTLAVTGTSFGAAAVHGVASGGVVEDERLLDIWVGGRRCKESVAFLDTEVRCTTPRIVGDDNSVVVVVGGVEVVSGVNISAASPTVESVTPEYLLAGGEALQDVLVNGTNFGLVPSDFDLEATTIGGVPCGSITVVSPSTSFLCSSLNTSVATATFQSSERLIVRVSVRGISTSSRGVFEGIGGVGVIATSALGAARTDGGGSVRVIADGLGLSSSDTAAIHLTSPLSSTTLTRSSFTWSELNLQFLLPPGIGTVSVSIESSVGAVSSPISLQYDPPTITSISPPSVLPGETKATLTIRGRNFVPSLIIPPTKIDSTLLNATITGIVCSQLHPVSSTELRCHNFSVPSQFLSELEDDEEVVELCVGGSGGCSGRVSGLITRSPPPSISLVSPAAITTSTALTIIGDGFGLEATDVGGVFVGEEECTDVEWLSPSSITCNVPSSHDEIESGGDDGFVAVRVCNRNSVCSTEYSVPLLLSTLTTPIAIPEITSAYREVSQPGKILLTISYPSLTEEALLIAASSTPSSHGVATSFVVTATTASSSSSSSTTTTTIDRDTSTTSTTITSSDVLVLQRVPYSLSVIAKTSTGGASNSSSPFAPVHETCSASQYLFTTAPKLEDQVCQTCPDDVAVCGGLGVENVTAREGYWRVGWAKKPFGFAQCIVPAACLGYSKAGLPTGTSNLTIISNLGSKVAVPGLTLLPDSHEGCAEGHEGTLCNNCEETYFPDSNGNCIPCGDPTFAWLRISGVIILFILIILFLIARAVFTDLNQAKGKEVVVARLLLSHLQTISIVARTNTPWTVPLLSFFSVSSASSSLTLQGVSVECVFGESGRDLILMSGLTMYVLPPIALCLAALFWFAWSFCRENRGVDCGKFMQRLRISSIVIAFFLHSTITSTAFSLLTCRDIYPEPHANGDERSGELERRMIGDLELSCDDTTLRPTVLGLSIPILLVFSFGIPLGLGIFLVLHRSKHGDLSFRKEWAFLIQGLRKESIFWESWVMVRKLTLILVTVLLATSSSTIQLSAALLVTGVALTAHAWIKPFTLRLFNVFELCIQATAAITILAALFLISASQSSQPAATQSTISIAVTTVVLLCNAAILLAALAIAIWGVVERIERFRRSGAVVKRDGKEKGGGGGGGGEVMYQNKMAAKGGEDGSGVGM